MELLSRHVAVPKSYEEVCQIIQSSAYYLPKGNLCADSFSMHCAKRYKGAIISSIPVKGKIRKCNQFIEVTISTHADLGFYIGCFLCLVGIVGLIWCLLAVSTRWVPCVGAFALGTFVSSQSIWEGKDLLDKLERRLLD